MQRQGRLYTIPNPTALEKRTVAPNSQTVPMRPVLGDGAPLGASGCLRGASPRELGVGEMALRPGMP